MKMTDFSRRAIIWRRESREMAKNGYIMKEIDYRTVRAGRSDTIIADVRISCDGKYIYYKLGTSTD